MTSEASNLSGATPPVGDPCTQQVGNLTTPTYYVGIGASAGGLEAIEEFFNHVPPDCGLAFILIQHLSPDYKSLMVELLSKRTSMPVYRAESGMTVSANCVYLIPPKKHLTIFHGKLILSDQERSRSGVFFPIDLFLRSLADDQGDRAIAVILSGTGSDGTRGVRAIKESGGVVMVQDEASAKFDGMPRSAVSTGLVDFILPPDEMPRQLMAFAHRPEQSRLVRSDTILTDEDGLTRIFALLRERHKIDFTYYKPSTVVRRIERRMTVNHINELQDYVKFLESYPREVSILNKELLIGVTRFFRDSEAFDRLSNEYLPQLLHKSKDSLLRFWVAGCSTGEEAYTLAILCNEALEKIDNTKDVKIFATDVDNDAVLHAGNGIYPESITADIAPEYLSKYFLHRDGAFQVSRKIREMVVFAQHNLVKDPPFTNIELVACRNLLIYLQPVLQRKILEYFNFSLNPGGLLFLGHSESVGDLIEDFEPLSHKWKIFRSKGKRRIQLAELDPTRKHSTPSRLARPPFLGPQKAMRLHEEERILDRLLDTLSGDYVPLTLVVNDQMELFHVVGDATGILRYPSGRVVNDITRLVDSDLSIPLSTGLQKAFKRNEEVRYTNVRLHGQGNNRIVNLRIKPFQQKKSHEPLVAIFIENDENRNGSDTRAEPLNFDIDMETAQRIEDLEQELQFARENLQATIEELETSNEELQATNEELLASNEELQSTNEELQSMNEEMHTVNSEHQRKIMELTELNNDIRNLMSSTGVGTVFLDENLEVRRFTPQIVEVMDLSARDIGRHVSQLSHHLVGVDLLKIIRTVTDSNETAEQEVRTDEGNHYLMRILPYAVGSSSYSGIVIAFIDINRQVHSRIALAESETKLSILAENLEDVFWIRTPDNSKMVYISPAYHTFWGRDPDRLYQNPQAYFSAVHPADQWRVSDHLEQHAQGVWDIEYRIVKPDGTIRWIHDRGFPIRDSAGGLELMCGFASDITESKTREDNCRLSLDRIKDTFDHADMGVVLVGLEGQFIDVNLIFRELLGYPDEEWKAMRFHQVISSGDASATKALFSEITAGRLDFHQSRISLLHHDHHKIPVSLTTTLIRAGSGLPRHILCLVQSSSSKTTSE